MSDAADSECADALVQELNESRLCAADFHGCTRCGQQAAAYKTAVEWMERHCDCGLVERVLYENPARVLEDRIL